MKKNTFAVGLVLAVILLFVASAAFDNYYMPNYKKRFAEIEKQRVIVSNKLTTAKIVQENLNHVRDLIFHNMDFPGQPDTIDHETQFFGFVTTCVNDLKLKLVSVRPAEPAFNNRVTTFGYDVEIEGDFFKFGELCAKFENNRRIVSVESFDVDLITDGQTKPNEPHLSQFKGVRIKMRVNTYRIAGKG